MSGLNFVTTAVLQPKGDGKFVEEHVEQPEAERRHPDLAKLDNRTLYEQLEANKAVAEEERLMKYKMNFAPPPGIDEEEAVFLEEQQDLARRIAADKAAAEAQDRNAFRAAMASRTLVSAPALPKVDELASFGAASPSSPGGKPKARVVKAKVRVKGRDGAKAAPKRRAGDEEPAASASDAKGAAADGGGGGDGRAAKQRRTEEAVSKPVATVTTALPQGSTGIAGLEGFGSSSEDDDSSSDSDSDSN